MLRRSLLAGLVLTALAAFSPASMAQEAEPAPQVKAESKGVGHRLLFYLPNRFLDLLDVVRARVRIGPGLAAGVRATEWATVFIGGYTTIYVGLPGPRGRPELPPLLGREVETGARLLITGDTTQGENSPGYAPDEFGAGAQLGLLGADAGVSPVELLDLLGGFFLIDIRGDDF